MTKKLAITYTLLFLFVFTFALSFTLASRAQAEPPVPACCVYEWCSGYEGVWIGIQGHWGEDFYGNPKCYFWPGYSTCDIWCQCPCEW